MAATDAKPKATTPGTSFRDIGFTYVCGLGVMGATAPVIHPFNVVAASAAKTHSGSFTAASRVYGGLGGNPPNRPANFWSGLPGHLSKELVRSWGRIAGVVYFDPLFKETLSPSLAPHSLACVMAAYEVAFANPADVWKSYRSTGLATKTEDLFKGSLGNFGRQYMMWFVWSKTIGPIQATLESSGVDPASKSGIAARSVMQSAACTLFTYPVELGLRTVQVCSTDYPVKTARQTLSFISRAAANPSLIASESAYFLVFRDLIRKNGVRGLGLGMSSKFVGNAILLGGANYMPMLTAYVKTFFPH